MKTTNTKQRTGKNLLKLMAKVTLLAILFVFVFAGALSASFAVEDAVDNAIEKFNPNDYDIGLVNGVIDFIKKDQNVAYAASTPSSITAVTTSEQNIDLRGSSSTCYWTAINKEGSGFNLQWETYGDDGWGDDGGGSNGNYAIAYVAIPISTDVQNAVSNGQTVQVKFEATVSTTTRNDFSCIALHASLANVSSGTKSYTTSWGQVNGVSWNTTPTNKGISKWSDDGTVNHRTSYTSLGSISELYAAVHFVSDGGWGVAITAAKVYFKWTSNPSVSFTTDGNGSVSSSSKTFTSSTDSISVTATPNSGYHFANWSKSYSETIYGLADNWTTTNPYTFTGSVRSGTTFTANFARNTKTVNYNANGGSGAITGTTITYGSGGTLASSGFTRTNYILVGWDTDQNATTATYSLGYTVTSAMTSSNTIFDLRAASTHGTSVTLYAVWRQSDFGVKDGKSRTDGTWGSQSNPFLIQNATHLTNLAAIVNADLSVTPKPAFDSVKDYSFQTVNTVATTTDFNGCYFEITASFSANAQFEVIGSSARHFKGTIVGGGETITIAVSGSTYVGFIGYLEGGGVSNLTIAGSVTATGNYSGGIAAYAKNTTISSCTNTATINGKTYSGGIAGKAEGSTISSCTNSGTISCSGSSYIGGIVGTTDNATISGCSNSAGVTGAQYTAGIIGRADRGSGTNLTNSGNVSGTGQVAGIVGQADTTETRFSLGGNITNTGNITGTGGMVGGIGGQYHGTFASGAVIVNGNSSDSSKGTISGGGDSVGGCFAFNDRTMADITSITNYGAVTGTTSLGGIVGRTQNVIKNATNRGTVTSTGGTTSSERPISCTAVGGITGFSTAGVSNSKNYGTISSSAAVIAVGGIIGTYNSGNTSFAIENCFNEGTISCGSATNVGGIAGYWAGSINHCYNSANITGSSNVGGIVGYLVSTSSPIQYCLNYNAQIIGSAKGAILGTSASSSSELQHCFALNAHSQGFSGSETSTYHAEGCWSFYASVTPIGNNPKYAVVPSLADANLIPKKNSVSTPANTTNSAWKDIVNAADTVDGFAVKISITSGNYFSSRTSDANTDSGYFTPTNVLDAYSSGTDDVIVHYIDTASGNTLYASRKAIVTNGFTTGEYNGTPQGMAVIVPGPTSSPYSVANTYAGRDGTSYTPAGEYKTIGSDDPNTYTGDYYRKVGNNYINLGPATGNPKQRPANATHWLDTSSAPAPKDAGKYTYSATVKLNGQSVGALGTSNFKITPRILTITNKWTVVESENSTETDARNNKISNNSFVFKNVDQGLNEIKVSYDGGTEEYKTISADGDLNNDSLFGGVAVFEANVGNFQATDAKNSGSPNHYSYAIELVDKTNFKMSYAGNAAGDNTNGYDTDGVITFTYQIAPRNINSSIDLMAFGYQYNNTYHDIANSAKANAYSLNANTKTWYTASGGGNANDFALNYAASQNDVNALHTAKPALVYIDSQVATYFKLYFSFDKSTISEALQRGNDKDFTLSSLGSFSGDAATVGSKDVTITITGQGNYTGKIYVKYTLMRSDFGGQFATAGWGTSTSKPFVIENDAHLLRLSQIVNGETEAWNSWYSKNSTIVTSSTINDSTYKTAYFKVANNATLHAMTAGGFVPIGRRYVDSTVVPVPANYSGDCYTYNGSSYTKDNVNGTYWVSAFSGTFDGNSANGAIVQLDLSCGSLSYVGLFGYTSDGALNNFTLQPVDAGTITTTGAYVGSLVGLASSTPISTVLNSVSITTGTWNGATYTASSGGNYTGGIAGYSTGAISTVTNTGTVKGGAYVGGIAGYATSKFTSVVNQGSVTGGGNYVGGIVGDYEPGSATTTESPLSVSTADSGRTVTGAGYVGGYFGQIQGTKAQVIGGDNETVISGMTIAKNANNNFFGGLVGYSNNTGGLLIRNIKLTAGSVQASGRSYVGGIIGGGTNVHLESVQFINPSGSSTWRIDGGSYTGGLAGALERITISEVEYSTNNIDSNCRVNTNVRGTSYVGGYIGKFDTSETINFTPILRANGLDPSTTYDSTSYRTRIQGNSYTGSLFGYVKGNGYKYNANGDGASKIILGATDAKTNVYACVTCGANGDVIGGAVGYASNVAIVVAANINTGYFFKTNSYTINDGGAFTSSNTTNYFGGLVGVLGANATIACETNHETGGHFQIKGLTAVSNVGNFVGGIVGFISPRAGEYSYTNTTIIGNTVNLINQSPITASGDFVGGLVGFMGIGAGTVTGISLPTAIASDATAGGNIVVFKPVDTSAALNGSAKNTANIVGANYVGGLVGCVGASDTETEGARVEFVNTTIIGGVGTYPDDVEICNGTDSTRVRGTGNNIGGIAGAISGNRNSSELKYVFSTGAPTGEQAGYCGVYGANNVGGIVGLMQGGAKIENSFFSRQSNTNTNPYTASHVYGTLAAGNVGGIVGFMTGGNVVNCVSMGVVIADVTSTKSGVAGYVQGGEVTDSWAIYHKSYIEDPTTNEMPNTYADSIDTRRGKGVIIISGYGSSGANALQAVIVPTFEELGQMVGLITRDETHDLTTKRVTTQLAGEKDYISVAAGLPNQSGGSVLQNWQLVFYDASGSESTYAISNFSGKASVSGTAYLKLAMSQHSFTIGVMEIKFRDVPQFTGENNSPAAKNNFTAHYVYPANDTSYHATANNAMYGNYGDGANIPKVDPQYISSAAGIVYVGDSSSFKIGEYLRTFTTGSEETPYIISNITQWNSFATDVNNGTKSYYGEHVKLATDLTANNSTITTEAQFAGSLDDTSKVFKGTFNGDGHTIKITLTSITSKAGVSLFPNANGAVIKNLTIDGTITTATSSTASHDSNTQNGAITSSNTSSVNIAGFVGEPQGNVTFVNCTNSVDVTGYKNVGGFVGHAPSGKTVTIIDCVNEGSIRSFEVAGAYADNSQYSASNAQLDYQGGTGGFIGNIDGTTVLDSCRNDGTVRAPQNVGGIVGRSTQTLNIYNCANTENATITGDSGYDTDAAEAADIGSVFGYGGYGAYKQSGSYNVLNYVGGIVGKTTGSAAALNLYASYNEATITAYGSIAGGLVGSIGTYIPLQSWFGGNPDQTNCGTDSIISYCFNKGKVQTGGDSPKSVQGWMVHGVNRTTGSMAGGIVGCFGQGRISYCYNVAEVVANGGDGYAGIWINRVGGIVAHAQPAGSGGNYNDIYIDNCYNTGLIKNTATRRTVTVGSWGDDSLKMGGTIVGFIDFADYSTQIKNAVHISNCYSTALSYYNARRSSSNRYSDIGTYDNLDQMSSGVICSRADMTALMRNDGVIAPNGKWINGGSSTGAGSGASAKTTASSTATLVDINGNSVKNTSSEFNPTYSDDFKSGTLNGWLYIYGCLPQLAVFTLGTRKGYSMLATSYGRNNSGDFVPQQAGGQYSPYIVKDGIHLMGMTALTNAYYSFEGVYVEASFNGTVNGKSYSNNIKNLTVKGINMPTSNATDNEGFIADKNAYKGTTSETSGNYVTSKTYFLLTEGALYKGDRTNSTSGGNTSVLNTWKSKNYYSNGTNWSTTTGYDPTIANFYPIGGMGTTPFKGSFNGYGLLVNGVNMKVHGASVDLGLFGRTQNATITKVGASGKVYGYATSASGTAAVGAIVGRACSGTVLDGCFAGYSGLPLTVQATASSLSPNGYVGGITGVADTRDVAGANVAASKVYLKNCDTKNATVKTFKNTVGGTVGYAMSGTNGGTFVYLQNCKTTGATIQTADNNNDTNTLGIKAGGIIGTQDDKVLLNIEGCSVGNGSLNPNETKTVHIYGENSIGGIIGVAGMNLVIGDYKNDRGEVISTTNVYGDVEIKRMDSWGTVLNAETYGTAIGGIIGYTPNATLSATPNIILGGTLLFAGVIDMNGKATENSNTPGGIASNGFIESVGGVAGFFGAGSSFATGSTIYVVGSINTGSIENVRNIGGVAGQIANAALGGTFYVAPAISAENGVNIGGFIGTATGDCAILADNTNIQIGGEIRAKQYVGGFIGYIGSTAVLRIGPAAYNGVTYSGTLDITIDDALSFTLPNNGGTKTCDPTLIVATNGYVGGIVGANVGGTGYGIAISKGNIVNEGQVVAASTVTVSGTGNNRTVSISGRQNYAGGIIGQNSGAFTFSGGTLENRGKVDGAMFVGGSIGAMSGGSISGASNVARATFKNSGTVDGTSYVGGAIGALAGNTNFANFINNGTVQSTTGSSKTAIGGAIGYIGWVSDFGAKPNGFSVNYQNTHAEYSSTNPAVTLNLSVTGGSGGAGGVGGVIGIISADTTWGTGNTFYVAGNVTASAMENVGGTVGLIEANNVEIKDMLAYNTKITGANNVGGIVGKITGTGSKITNSFNVTPDPRNGVAYTSGDATIYYGGIVGRAAADTDASTSYWVKAYTNDELTDLDISNLSNLGRTMSITINGTTMAKNFFSVNKTPHDWDSNIGESVTWETYLGITMASEIPDGYSVQSGTEGTGDDAFTYWFYENSSFKQFSTGNAHTGWYLMYAYDDDFKVRTKYANADADNRAYWKYIANCYSGSETRWANNSGHTSNIVYSLNYASTGDITASSNINSIPNGDMLHAYADAPTVSGYYLYAAASGTGGQNEPAAVHFVRSMERDNSNNARMYIRVNKTASSTAGNVAIFYRSISAGKALKYNGTQRFAPLSVEESEMPFKTTELAVRQAEDQYVYAYPSFAQTYETYAGGYTSDIDIYYSPVGTQGEGVVYKVGFIDDMPWKIQQRDIKVGFNSHAGTYGETNSYLGAGAAPTSYKNSLQVIVSNISPFDQSSNGQYLVFKFEVKKGNNAYGDTIFDTSLSTDANLANNESKFYVTYGMSGLSTSIGSARADGLVQGANNSCTLNTSKKIETDHTLGTVTDQVIDSYVLTFHFKDASTYKVVVSTDTRTISGSGTNVKTSYKTISSSAGTGEMTVGKRNLTVGLATTNASAIYDGDGSGHENTFFIGDGLATATTQWRYASDVYNTTSGTHGMPDFNLSIIWVKKNGSVESVTLSGEGTGRITGSPYTFSVGNNPAQLDYNNKITVSGFKEYGTYYLHFGSITTNDGNYSINKSPAGNWYTVNGYGSNNLKLYGITENEITITWNGTSPSRQKIYDTNPGTVSFTVVSDDSKTALKDIRATVNELISIYRVNSNSYSGAPDYALTTSDVSVSGNKKSMTATLKTGKTSSGSVVNCADAGTYYFKLAGAGNDNITLTYTNGDDRDEDNYSVVSYTINKATLSLGYTMTTGSSPYTYNTSHQGIASFSITGLLGSDSVALSGTASSTQSVLTITVNNGDVANPATINGSTITMQNCIDAGAYSCTWEFSSINYNMTGTKPIAWTINKKTLTLTALSNISSVYDGTVKSATVTLEGHQLSGGTSSFTSDNDTITVTVAYADASGDSDVGNRTIMKDVGVYSVSVDGASISAENTSSGTDRTSNYQLSGNSSATYTITPKSLTVTLSGTGAAYTSGVNAQRDFIYNGYAQGVSDATFSGFVAGESLTNARGIIIDTDNVDQDTSNSTGTKYALEKKVNASPANNLTVYEIEITTASGYLSNYSITTTSASWTIAPQTITLPTEGAWSTDGDIDVGYYSYTGGARSPYVVKIKLGATEKNMIAGTGKYYGTPDNAYKSKFGGEHASEYIWIIVGNNNSDVSNSAYTAAATDFAVDGSNEAGDASKSNYTFNTGSAPTSSFVIVPAIVTVTLTGLTTKTYDSTATAPSGKPGYTVTNNNGSNSVPADNKISFTEGTYRNDANTADDANVKTSGKMMRYRVTLTDNNYAFSVNLSGNTPVFTRTTHVSGAIGQITPAELTITLNLKGSTTPKASKAYDNQGPSNDGTKFAYWSSTSANSDVYKKGQGFSVSGIQTNDASGQVTINAYFQEADRGRDDFDGYVNNVEEYPKDSGKFKIRGMHYKRLYFVVDGTSAGNYTYTVTNYVSNKPGTFSIYDSRDTTNASGNGQSGTINIEITPRTVRAEYDNTTQSYANADNTLNTTWLAVKPTTASVTQYIYAADNVSIKMINKWRGVDSEAESVTTSKTFASYTVFSGSTADNTDLGAKLVGNGNNGKELNYSLREQPTLIIGYFVDAGDGYQVGSMAGLILATYYYEMNFVEELDVPTVSAFHQVVSAADYEAGTGTKPAGYESKTWDQYFADFNETHLDTPIEFDTSYDAYGYWYDKEVSRDAYADFIQVANISGELTDSDITILAGQFGNDWGAGNTYLTNFLNTTKGNVITVIDSFFKNHDGTPFCGTYDGAGYTIDHVNLMSYIPSGSATYNIGMFEEIGSGTIDGASKAGEVTGLNLRNWNIVVVGGNTGNTLNVGGIVGKSAQSTSLANSSFHGTIDINAPRVTVNAGGLVGQFTANSVVAVNGAISVGNMYIKGSTVNVGGIMGNLASASSTLNKVVSMTGIFSTATTNVLGGILGTTTWASADRENAITSTKAYVTDSVVNMSNGTTVNMYIGNGSSSAGVSYTALINGSTSGYSAGTKTYLGLGSAPAASTYDVIADRTVAAGALVESPRLIDIIKIYVLLYAKTTTTNNGVKYYMIADSSDLVGTALGTTGSRIEINNIQQVAYLREFRFACFTLTQNVDMYNQYANATYAGAFYGSVFNNSDNGTPRYDANGYKINLRESGSPAKMFQVELSGHALPVKVDAA